MKKYFCNGKKDFCEMSENCSSECPHYDGTGGDDLDVPPTNADRIRAMDDEELAKLLLDGCCGSKCEDQPQNEWGSVNCFQCRMKWLQMLAEEDDHDNREYAKLSGIPIVGKLAFMGKWSLCEHWYQDEAGTAFVVDTIIGGIRIIKKKKKEET